MTHQNRIFIPIHHSSRSFFYSSITCSFFFWENASVYNIELDKFLIIFFHYSLLFSLLLIQWTFGKERNHIRTNLYSTLITFFFHSRRWRLFTNEINESNMNEEWWKLRRSLQGLEPPIERTENDFDAGSKYHIPANVPYIRYASKCFCDQINPNTFLSDILWVS